MRARAALPWRFADFAACALVAGAIALLLWRAAAELNYQWRWTTPLQYVASRDDGGRWAGGLLLDGLIMSARLMFLGGALALLIGAALALAALSRAAALRWLTRLYVEALRHLPPLVFIFIFFYLISARVFDAAWWRAFMDFADGGVARVLFGPPAQRESLLAGVLCLALFEAAFFCEIIRAGVLSVDAGQRDAGRSMGMSRALVFRLIILPQALSRTAAPLTGQWILLIKDSALLSVVSVQDLTFSAQETAVSTQQIFETWLLAAAFYFALCFPLLLLSRRLEKPAEK